MRVQKQKLNKAKAKATVSASAKAATNSACEAQDVELDATTLKLQGPFAEQSYITTADKKLVVACSKKKSIRHYSALQEVMETSGALLGVRKAWL